MDGMDNRNERHDRNDRNGGYRQRDFRGPRRRDGNFGHGGPHRGGRSQRPLLTTATNAAGLVLVAMVVLMDKGQDAAKLMLSGAVVAFGVSALVSYFAQRMRGPWVEKISDVFFLIGVVIVIYEAAQLGGLLH